MASTMSEVSELQVKAEKDRLAEAKLIAESEKRLYVKVSLILLTMAQKCVSRGRGHSHKWFVRDVRLDRVWLLASLLLTGYR